MRVVFFGTPQFAVPSLRALLDERHDVAAVVTQPDRPQGRSRSRLVPPPVKSLALERGIPVLQPERPVGDVFAASLRRLEPELGVVVAYGHILRPEILAIPRRGMINVHASLLPRFRGAAPIQWAIAEGEPETGVTIMQMEAGLDSGPILHRVATPIGPRETAGELAARLAELGAEALVRTIADLAAGTARPQPQDHAAATYAPKIERETARLDWMLDADVLCRRIRAFDPVPGAWTLLAGEPLKLFTPEPAEGRGVPGMVLEAGERLVIAAGHGAVAVREVQPAGRTRLAVADWVRGRGIAPGDRLG